MVCNKYASVSRPQKVRYRKSTSTSISTSKNFAPKKSQTKSNETKRSHCTWRLDSKEKDGNEVLWFWTFFSDHDFYVRNRKKKESQSIIRSLALVEIHFFPLSNSYIVWLWWQLTVILLFFNAKVWPVRFIFMRWLHFMALYIRTQLSDDE